MDAWQTLNMATPPPSLSPSSTLVNVVEHAELRLVRLLAESAPAELLHPAFESNCDACIATADAPALIRTILGDAGAMASLFGMEPMEEAISAFSLLAALLDKVDPARSDEEAALVNEVADAITRTAAPSVETTTTTSPTALPKYGIDFKRISMLCVLYNLRTKGQEKCHLLARIVQIAASSDPKILCQGQPLGDVLDATNLQSALDQWSVPGSHRRILYRAAAHAFSKLDTPEAIAARQRFLLLLVETYVHQSEIDGEALTTAKEAAVEAIRDPVTMFSEQRGMLSMPAIDALRTNAATSSLHELLRIFQEGKLEDFQAYLQNPESSKTILDNGLSSEECIRHMRLLSLCSLAAEHEEIPYSAIASTLQVSDEEVETWVIAAVSSSLLAAKMDQLQHVVIVERCVVRQFGLDQWKALQGRLHAWKKNVRGVLEGLKQQGGYSLQQQQKQAAPDGNNE